MARTLPPKRRLLIPSSFLVRALTRGGRRYACRNCREPMFVRYESGLCPHCFNGRRELTLAEPARQVPEGRALAGVLDDPAIEQV
jgi:hypothetical protein